MSESAAEVPPAQDDAPEPPMAGGDIPGSDPGARPGAAAGRPSTRDRLFDRLGRLSFSPPSWADRALEAAIVGTKAATLACAVDALVNADSPRFRGKGARTRGVGYAMGLVIVPAVWRMLPDRGRYPRGLDLAVTLPLLIDAGG